MRILLLEDEEFMVRHIEASLRAEFEGLELVHAAGVAQALELALQCPFDCLILDRMVGDDDGLDVLAGLRARGVLTPAIIASQLNDVEHRVQGLDQGADDYIGKNFEASELGARIRSAIRRADNQGHPRILKFDRLEMHRIAEAAQWDGKNLKLSPKEFRLLLCLVEAFPAQVSYETIWRTVWPEWKNLTVQKQPIQTTMSRLRSAISEIDGFEIKSMSSGYQIVKRES